MKATNRKVTYSSTGLVYGLFWGGGEGSYEAKRLTGTSKNDIIEQANSGIVSGSLDAGMGFECLLGAMLDIQIKTTVTIDGKEFENTDCDIEYIGDLTPEQMEHLETAYFYIHR